MLNSKQVAYYNSNGYLTIENVYSASQIKLLSDVTDEFVEKSRLVTEENDMFSLESDHSKDNPRLTRIKTPQNFHSIYKKAVKDEKMLDIIEHFIGKNIRFQGAKLNMKMPQGGRQVEWHTDWGHHPHTNDDMLAVGIALDDITEENGCLMVIPGSHKWDAISHHEDGFFVGAVDINSFDVKKAINITSNAGSISIHHVRTLHGSAPNMSDKPRRLLLLEFSAADAFPVSGIGTSWDEWNKQIFRGKPTIQPRLEKIPVLLPKPLRGENKNIFELQSNMKKSHFSKSM
ncbi:MAG: phytanoyl-CoA dioxygenase [Chloroflexi bacterium]|nr:phytanoyl-CoA dioxygenase [Chloroflexota bacterium]|tara:strand:+ start:849 stop:1712 length:864 start_codon:yes stop_codon:yes gene_type:complete